MPLVPLFEPKEFFDFAEKIFFCKKNNPHLFFHEALVRSGISRFYYACFLAVRMEFQAQLKGYPDILEELKKPSVHGLIIRTLKNSGVRECVEIGINLHKLRSLRNNADYDLEVILDNKDYYRARNYAKYIFSNLNCLEKIQNLETLIRKFL